MPPVAPSAFQTAPAVRSAYSCCNLCEHRCGVDRRSGELGFCRATSVARVFRHRVEYGEEIELVPSHLFYLSGCDLHIAASALPASTHLIHRAERT